MNEKKDLRDIFSKRRVGIPSAEAERLSQLVEFRAGGLDDYRRARTVGFYHPVRHEVSLWGLFHRSHLAGQRTFFPKVQGKSLVFVECREREDLAPGAFGIPEPREEGEVAPAPLDLVFVPGLVFDLEGFRVGYGQGYYDRFLAGFKGVSVGLAYDFQIVETLPRQGGDVPLNFVVTETKTLGRKS